MLRSFDAAALRNEGVRRRELLVPLANPPADLGAPVAEAVDMQWFDGVDAALAYLRSAFADACAWKLGGVAFGGARHLATEVDVV